MTGRPEKRLVKLQILVTDSELAKIDDWRFGNRAENRSSAVRELIALGLKFSEYHSEDSEELIGDLRKQ
jgi:hypothetical protein